VSAGAVDLGVKFALLVPSRRGFFILARHIGSRSGWPRTRHRRASSAHRATASYKAASHHCVMVVFGIVSNVRRKGLWKFVIILDAKPSLSLLLHCKIGHPTTSPEMEILYWELSCRKSEVRFSMPPKECLPIIKTRGAQGELIIYTSRGNPSVLTNLRPNKRRA
jgi:hypothetical protein